MGGDGPSWVKEHPENRGDTGAESDAIVAPLNEGFWLALYYELHAHNGEG